MSFWELYWLTRCQSLATLFFILCMVSSITSCFLFVGSLMAINSSEQLLLKKGVKYALPLAFVSGIFAALLPSNKDIALIYSGHFITHSEEMKKLPDNILKYLNTFLEEKK